MGDGRRLANYVAVGRATRCPTGPDAGVPYYQRWTASAGQLRRCCHLLPTLALFLPTLFPRIPFRATLAIVVSTHTYLALELWSFIRPSS
jgi:hypothetical protein